MNAATLERLQARIEALEAVIAERPPLAAQLRSVLGIQTMHADTLALLMRRETVTRSGLLAHLFEAERDCDQPEDGGAKLFDATMSKLRLVLHPRGIAIEAIWGVGWRMSRADKAKLKALLEG